jgi:hypothetical protein
VVVAGEPESRNPPEDPSRLALERYLCPAASFPCQLNLGAGGFDYCNFGTLRQQNHNWSRYIGELAHSEAAERVDTAYLRCGL